jgi:hypothetical protein
MRLYFHLTNGRDVVRDEDGIDVADVDAARREAQQAVEELRQEKDFDRRTWNGWRLEVTDASGVVLVRIGLSSH